MLSFPALLVIAILAGFYMAWNIGANDVANAMGTSIGSGALTLRRAVLLAGIFEFAGAFFVGDRVAQTIQKSIVPFEIFQQGGQDHLFAVGMLSALLAAAVWLNVATFFAQPVSTTHAIIGAVAGFGLVACGPGCIRWTKMIAIAASWVISPVAGGVIAFVIYRCIRRFVLQSRHPVLMAKQAVPIALGAVVCVVSLSVLRKVCRLEVRHIYRAVPLALVFGAVVALVGAAVIRKRTGMRRSHLADRYPTVERWFSPVQIVTACYLAFAHGANDVANSIGPLAAAIQIFRSGGRFAGQLAVPWWLLVFGGVGIVIGLGTYGYKVIEAIGRKITEITPTRGFAAGFATATTVLTCSLMGLPISTTLVLVGSVMGVGVARGFAAIDLRVIRRIFVSWVITIPVSAVLCAVIFLILRSLVA